MREDFVSEALRNGDECFAICAGELLCSYGWYSDKLARTLRNLYFYHNSGFKYERYAFTVPKYRGLRLHGILDAKACVYYSKSGYNGLLSIIEAHNFSSLRCHYRVGCIDAGKIYLLTLFGKYYSYSDRRAKKYGAMLKPIERLSVIGRLSGGTLNDKIEGV
jgi:hypothetical protein